jgi:hydrogenase-4 component B
LPVHVLRWLDLVGQQLLATTLDEHLDSWWLLSPISAERASYSPAILIAGLVLVVLVTSLLVRVFYHARVRRAAPWDCGFGQLDARMQDTAEGFGQPIRHIFEPFFLVRRVLPSPFDRQPKYSVEVEDPIWVKVHLPLGRAVQWAAGLVTWLQRGRVSTYLLYSFLTLLALLVLVL